MLNKTGSDNTKKQLAQHEKDITASEKRLNEINSIIKRLYEDSVTGKLTDERFIGLSKDYDIESENLKTQIREAQKAISSCKDTDSSSRQFTALIRKHYDLF